MIPILFPFFFFFNLDILISEWISLNMFGLIKAIYVWLSAVQRMYTLATL